MGFEQHLVEFCAPTLAGYKAGSLFRYRPGPGERTDDLAARWNSRLSGKGLRMVLLGRCPANGDGLVYLYRERELDGILAQPDTAEFLAERGYGGLDLAGCLALLSDRVGAEGCFPHEIGIFLGYPLEDVRGFVEHGGQNYRCCGCWKVYGDPDRARRWFSRLRRCTAVYRRLHRRGASLEKLAVSA